jgi:hypothetical protein
MIKYEIIRYSSDDYGGSLSKTKLVKKTELQKHLEKDWLLRKKIIPVLTPLKDWWKPISLTNKVAICGIILSAFLVSLFWGIDKYLENKCETLKSGFQLTNQKLDSLKKDSESLNQRYDSLTYILNEKNKLIGNLKEKLKTKTSSEKK